MGRISGLAEVVLLVQDLQKSVAFYRDTLGLRVISPRDFPAAFLRVGDERDGVPQQIVLVPRPAEARAGATSKLERDVHHIGLEVPAGQLETERSRLSQLGFAIRGGEHPFLPVEAFYLDDPDGNEIEIVAARVG
ncbi:MAG TPA: VOC family protein [Chloroflexota bacterium]|jgi:catechol 2,3-dioxygenase|nr:VOC family protein [Chloroflexota bacterium]